MDAIMGVKKLIADQVEEGRSFISGGRFFGYQKVYFSTNENINGYINEANLNSESRCLTVLASGDHAFNLIGKGLKNIDTFDVNSFAPYYAFGLRRAMILKYSYLEFIEINDKIKLEELSFEETTQMINDLLPHMDYEYKVFWQEIINYNYKLQKNNSVQIDLFKMLCIALNPSINYVGNNNYLINEDAYNNLKSRISLANLSYMAVDARYLGKCYQGKKYNAILLSNILDYGYWSQKDLEEYVSSLERILDDDSILFLKYVFLYGKNFTRNHLFMESDLFIDSEMGLETIAFRRTDNTGVKDAMILKRRK